MQFENRGRKIGRLSSLDDFILFEKEGDLQFNFSDPHQPKLELLRPS